MHELEALTATELRDLIDSGVSVAVVPFGSIEHQGTHLPLGADAPLADAVGSTHGGNEAGLDAAVARRR